MYKPWKHTCCSIKPFSGLMITPTASILLLRGPINMQRLLPDPVAMRTKTSHPCKTAIAASLCPGRKLEKPKYLCSVSCNFDWQELSPVYLAIRHNQDLAPCTCITIQENPKYVPNHSIQFMCNNGYFTIAAYLN